MAIRFKLIAAVAGTLLISCTSRGDCDKEFDPSSTEWTASRLARTARSMATVVAGRAPQSRCSDFAAMLNKTQDMTAPFDIPTLRLAYDFELHQVRVWNDSRDPKGLAAVTAPGLPMAELESSAQRAFEALAADGIVKREAFTPAFQHTGAQTRADSMRQQSQRRSLWHRFAKRRSAQEVGAPDQVLEIEVSTDGTIRGISLGAELGKH